jgi:hypothetical protein
MEAIMTKIITNVIDGIVAMFGLISIAAGATLVSFAWFGDGDSVWSGLLGILQGIGFLYIVYIFRDRDKLRKILKQPEWEYANNQWASGYRAGYRASQREK